MEVYPATGGAHSKSIGLSALSGAFSQGVTRTRGRKRNAVLRFFIEASIFSKGHNSYQHQQIARVARAGLVTACWRRPGRLWRPLGLNRKMNK